MEIIIRKIDNGFTAHYRSTGFAIEDEGTVFGDTALEAFTRAFAVLDKSGVTNVKEVRRVD